MVLWELLTLYAREDACRCRYCGHPAESGWCLRCERARADAEEISRPRTAHPHLGIGGAGARPGRSVPSIAGAHGDRRAVRLTVVSADTADREYQDETLRESEARHARMAATVPGVLYEVAWHPDGGGRFTYLSPRCSDVFELDRQVILDDAGVPLSMMHPCDARSFQEDLARAVRTRSPFSAEVRITTPSGRRKWIQFTSLPASRSPDGTETRSGLILDVTERRRTEEALRRRDGCARPEGPDIGT
jgi:PAS domain S-box-containing protein